MSRACSHPQQQLAQLRMFCCASPLQVDAHLMPAAARHAYGPEQHCGVGVIRMLRAF